MKIFLNFVLMLLILAAVACSSFNRSAWSKQDTWYHASAEGGAGPYNLPEIPCYVVTPEQQKNAESLLESVQIVEQSDMQVQQLLGKLPNKPKGTSFYLVRSVVLYEGTGKYAVFYDKSVLWVTHNCLGKKPTPMKRRPLIVPLEVVPKSIYVICGMDE